ncbi:MAG: diguanylate cyclase [Bacillota bacterium]|nr:diguanylate cyclase [Bacillota bacterium]
MRSIRTKITTVTICAIVLTMIIATVFGLAAIRNIGMSSSEQMMLLLCESGQKNINSYLEDVEQEVQTISAYVESDLDGLEDEKLQAHLDRVSDFFRKVLYRTNGIKTYYYRIDPAVSPEAKGFWYVRDAGKGFQEHEVTDITKYDTEDTTQLVWFSVPKAKGKPVWLPNYLTENLNERVISYNSPVYYKGRFVGVIGIEMDYRFITDQIDHITLFENGYAFINDSEGHLVYHPRMDVFETENLPAVPTGLEGDYRIIHYNYENVEKIAVSLPLVNGNRLNVSAPMSEIDRNWKQWTNMMVVVFGMLVLAFITFFMRYTRKITKPLEDLTRMAEQIDAGNYDQKLEYKGNDEIGQLTQTLNRVTANLKNYISGLNDLAYADALTVLHNKGAFDIWIGKLQARANEAAETTEFAVCIFDCNDLKRINDQYGHEKGDIYLKETAKVICDVYKHSPVFRIGGDEFAAILLDADYRNREDLLRVFDERCREKQDGETEEWKKVNVARGMAVYDVGEDESVSEVVRRADKKMYENKWETKKENLR